MITCRHEARVVPVLNHATPLQEGTGILGHIAECLVESQGSAMNLKKQHGCVQSVTRRKEVRTKCHEREERGFQVQWAPTVPLTSIRSVNRNSV
jgi:hypothetical protein